RALPDCSFALMPVSGAPRDSPRLKARQASEGLADAPCAQLALAQTDSVNSAKNGFAKRLAIAPEGFRLSPAPSWLAKST
ncbi:MAG: hypothetical protein WCA54_19985, partial [Pseudolabrys sp.]